MVLSIKGTRNNQSTMRYGLDKSLQYYVISNYSIPDASMLTTMGRVVSPKSRSTKEHAWVRVNRGFKQRSHDCSLSWSELWCLWTSTTPQLIFNQIGTSPRWVMMSLLVAFTTNLIYKWTCFHLLFAIYPLLIVLGINVIIKCTFNMLLHISYIKIMPLVYYSYMDIICRF